MINSALADDWTGDGHIDVPTTCDNDAILLTGPDWNPHPVFTNPPGLARDKLRSACIHGYLLDVEGSSLAYTLPTPHSQLTSPCRCPPMDPNSFS